MRVSFSKVTACALLIFFPATMFALPAQGTVQAQGPVTVNGAPVQNSTTLFSGDKIETGANGTATVSAPGTVVQLDPNTSAIFSDKALDLGCGGAEVTSTTGQVVRVSGISITPAGQGTTKFRVSQFDGTLKVTAEQGSVVVDDGTKHMLNAGQSLTRERAGGMCGPLATVPQGSSKMYIPAIAAAVVSGVVAYCAVNGFCSQASPSGP